MPIYDYSCPRCGFAGEFITPMMEYQKCPDCGAAMVRLMHSKFSINMGVGASGYYDETLGKYISTNRERREECRRQGVTPKGDTPKLGSTWI